MRVEIRIDPACREPKLILVTDRLNEPLQQLVQQLSAEQPQLLVGTAGDTAQLLEPEEIVRIYASGGRVWAETEHGAFQLRRRLYELEQQLAGSRFVRISNSDLVNLKKVRNFDLSFSGTICVALTNGTVTYVSRRYVAKIKQLLGMKGEKK